MTDQNKKLLGILAGVLLVILAVYDVNVVVPGTIASALKPAQGQTLSAQSVVPCYFENGGGTLYASAGCTIDVLAGANLKIESGATPPSIAGTPFFWATPQPTATAQPTPTLHTFYAGAGGTPVAGAKLICTQISVTGQMTATPLAPITTPQAVWASLAQAPTGDVRTANASHSSGVITVNVLNSALTPVAASGAGTVLLCEMGQ